MYEIPMFDAVLEKNHAAKYPMDIPAHEIPMMLTRWDSERFIVGEQRDDTFPVDNLEEEMDRLVMHYGTDLMTKTYGPDFPALVKQSLDKLSISKRNIDGENATKSKNGTSTTTRV
jgi:hypothetical protein